MRHNRAMERMTISSAEITKRGDRYVEGVVHARAVDADDNETTVRIAVSVQTKMALGETEGELLVRLRDVALRYLDVA